VAARAAGREHEGPGRGEPERGGVPLGLSAHAAAPGDVGEVPWEVQV